MKSRAKKSRVRAGSIVAKGADTCVFVPRVKCKNKFSEDEVKSREKNGVVFVSRLITRDNEMDAEVRAMEYLKVRIAEFQNVPFVQDFLTDHFLIATQQCTAEYNAEDKDPVDTFNACTANRQPIVFQTEKFQYNLRFYVDIWQASVIDDAMSEVCLAFLKINQNAEKVFVHNDLHAGNVGITRQFIARINDFGRAFLWPVQDSLDGTDPFTGENRANVFRNVQALIPKIQHKSNTTNEVETQAQYQHIKEVSVIYQIVPLMPYAVKAKVFFKNNSNLKLIRLLQQLQNSYCVAVKESNPVYRKYLNQLQQLMTYIFRYSDIFGLLRVTLKSAEFDSKKPTPFLQDLEDLYFQQFQDLTLNENDFWKLICKHKLGKFLCRYMKSESCDDDLCTQTYNTVFGYPPEEESPEAEEESPEDEEESPISAVPKVKFGKGLGSAWLERERSSKLASAQLERERSRA